MLTVFLFIYMLLPHRTTQSCCETPANRNALLALYNATTGAQWNNSRWNISDLVCTWQGVQCDGADSVVAIQLLNNNLQGTLPTQLASLTALQTFSIDNSPLLQGSIPSQWSALNLLKVLVIRNTAISGFIPSWFPSSMEVLELSYTTGRLNLSGAMNLFSNLAQLKTLRLEHLPLYNDDMSAFNLPPSLEVLVVADTRIKGMFPQGVGFMKRLRELNLSSMDFENRGVPPWLANVTSLVALDLSKSAFQGTLPSLENCTNLTTLVLSENNFVGLTPPWIGALTLLRTLDLRFSQYPGKPWLPMTPFHIDVNLGKLELLEFLDLSTNSVKGPLPDNLFENMTRLRYLAFDSAEVRGSLPSSLARLVSLQHFDCGFNSNLSGTFPDAFWTHRGLATIGGYNCNISGTIPGAIGNLTLLHFLHLSNNRLSGSIPSSFGKLRSISYAFLDHNCLSGTLPEEISDLASLATLQLQGNSLTGSLPSFANNLKLDTLELSYNHFSGQLPAALLTARPIVSFIKLSGNSFSGTLPHFSNLSRFMTLDLSNNSIGGTIPTSIRFLSRVTTLDLSFNSLSGAIPSELCALPSTNFFSLSHNNLSGTLPAEIGDIGNGMYSAFSISAPLNLSHNRFVGDLPQSISRLLFTQLDFSHNSLSGGFPIGVANITRLKELNLQRNQFSGPLPPNEFFVSSMQQLITLQLDQNNFSGTIPEALGRISALSVLTLAENYFNGTLPSMPSMQSATQINVSSNRLTGTLPEAWAVSVMRQVASVDLSFNFFSGKLPSSWALAPIRSGAPEELLLGGLTFCRPVPSSWWNSSMFARALTPRASTQPPVLVECSPSKSQTNVTATLLFSAGARRVANSPSRSVSRTALITTGGDRDDSLTAVPTPSMTEIGIASVSTPWATAGSGVAGIGAGVVALTSLLIGGGPSPGIAMLQVGLGSGKLSQRNDDGTTSIATEMLDNPFLIKIESAPIPLRYASGCILGNALTVIVCVLVKLVVKAARQIWRHRSDKDTTTFTKMRRAAWTAQQMFPGAIVSPITFVLQPTVMSCVALLAHPSSTAPLMCLGAIGAAVLILPVVCCAHYVYRRHNGHVAAVDVALPFTYSTFGSCLVRMELLLKRIFAARWAWVCTQSDRHWFLRRFYAFILPFREGMLGISLYELGHMIACGAVIGFGLAYGETEQAIRAVASASQWCVAGLALLRLVVLVKLQPFSVIADNLVQIALSALNLAAVVTLVTVGDGDVAQAASYIEVSFLVVVTSVNYAGMLRFRSPKREGTTTAMTFDVEPSVRSATIECHVPSLEVTKEESPSYHRHTLAAKATSPPYHHHATHLQCRSTQDAERHLAALVQLISSQTKQPLKK